MACPSFSEQVADGLAGKGIGVLKIWINRASHLAYTDGCGASGLPSAVVKMMLGNKTEFQEKTTEEIDRNANPEWHSSAFSFEIKAPTDQLRLECWDLVGQGNATRAATKYFLGRYEVPVQFFIAGYEDVARHHGKNHPARLHERLEGSKEGRIDITWLYEPYDSDAARKYEMIRAALPQQAHRHGHHGHHGGHGYLASTRGLPGPGAPSIHNIPDTVHNHTPGSRGFERSMSGHSMGSHSSLGVLSVRVIRAENLVNADSGILGDVSDPYVTMKLASQLDKKPKRTVTIDDNLNPEWNSPPFLFQITKDNDALILEVWDEDSRLISSSDDFLGRLTIPLEKFIQDPNNSLRLKDHLQGIAHGILEVEVGFSPG
jgi:hypothetical protein